MTLNSSIKIFSALTILCAGFGEIPLATSQAASGMDAAPKESFIGKWKLDPSRSKLSDEMKVQAIGENKYGFDFGSGKLETIAIDGTDQPGEFGTTLAVSAQGPNLWKVVRKQNAHTLISANWELSGDGNTLTDHFTSFKPDGSANPTEDYKYKRTAGSNGFAGTWESTMEPQVFQVEIRSFEGDGLALIGSDQQSTRNIKFDGKDYPASGPNFPAGFSSSGRRVDARTLQITEKVAGDTFDTQDVALSSDGKTLTMTQHLPSQSKPKIYVFTRQ